MMSASVALALSCLEVGVRFWDGVPITAMVNFSREIRELNLVVNKNNPAAQYDAHFGWVQVPFLRTEGFVTGDHGVRMPGPEILPLQQDAVLMVGDSFGAGSGVSGADSWPAQLEQLLGTQVINAGVGGYGFDQIILRAEYLLPRLKPRTLFVETRLDYGNWANRLAMSSGAPKPYFVADHDHLVLKNEPVPRTATTVGDIGMLRAALGYSYLVQYVMMRLNLLQWWVTPARNKFVLSNDESVDVTCLLLKRLGELRDRYKIPVTVVFQYSGVDGMSTTLPWEADRERLLGCAEQARLKIIDLLNELRSAYRTNGLPFYQRFWLIENIKRIYGHKQIYSHMSPEGNRFVADAIANRLRADGLIETTSR